MGSACYVYAIVGGDTPLPPEEHGNASVGLARVVCGKLAAVTEPAAGDRSRLTTEAVLRHEAVVEAVRLQGPALPVRFGTVFRDAGAVTRALEERHDELAADLERVGDKVELSLTVLWPDTGTNEVAHQHARVESAPGGAARGAAYLRARAAELERGDALIERARSMASELHERFGAFALDRRVALMPKPLIAVRATYLVEPRSVAAFRSVIDAVRGEWRVLLTGPWPPYSFVRQRDSRSVSPMNLQATRSWSCRSSSTAEAT